jgi:hypothetical protein
VNPGWYPDPYSHGWLRWWDGTAWTSSTAPMEPPAGGLYRADPDEDLAGERRAARRAMITVVVTAVLAAGSAVVFALVRTQRIADGTNLSPAAKTASFLITIATLGLEVFFMIWLYRAAGLARKAGLPARRDPVWAILGFFIPVVNFWFPYQVARDCLPYGDPRRRLSARWWTWYLISAAFGAAAGGVGIVSRTGALIAAAIAVVGYVLSAWYTRRMITAIGDAHTDLVRTFNDVTAR